MRLFSIYFTQEAYEVKKKASIVHIPCSVDSEKKVLSDIASCNAKL